MVPFGGGEGKFGLFDAVGWEEVGEIGPLVEVGAAFVLDLAGTDYRFAWFVTCLGCGACRVSFGVGVMGGHNPY